VKPIFAEQREIAGLNRELTRLSLLLGEVCEATLIRATAIGTTSTRVPHGLKGIPNTVIPCNLSADARVWRASSHDEKYLYLIANVAVTCDLLVF